MLPLLLLLLLLLMLLLPLLLLQLLPSKAMWVVTPTLFPTLTG